MPRVVSNAYRCRSTAGASDTHLPPLRGLDGNNTGNGYRHRHQNQPDHRQEYNVTRRWTVTAKISGQHIR
ncbi:hypothetical protein CCHOA_03450 [Corynebacterium choanae]|uniref:Uncharacterized protein n=1 Tax=Corynebacterium choanae TaxID=1862358 RepID=A0A3G6J4T2_9CORY|nr:hypothetical protein CCHOA_03450 [Corynebacterium choanae]